MGKFIVSSNSIILEETVKNFSLAQTFEAEDVSSCMEKIQQSSRIGSCSSSKLFNKIHSTSPFIEKQKVIYATK